MLSTARVTSAWADPGHARHVPSRACPTDRPTYLPLVAATAATAVAVAAVMASTGGERKGEGNSGRQEK